MPLTFRRLWMKSPATTSSIGRQGELRHDQSAPEAGRRAGAARLAGVVLERRDQCRPRVPWNAGKIPKSTPVASATAPVNGTA